ncbi:MAG: cytochrome c4 [Gammaproteobacteria bacterium]|nr:cytochrome c4 [Gammaproteobacteria bacterium]
MKHFISSVLLVAATLATASAIAADAAAGEARTAACAACHGADGNSANAIWPKLAGQHAEYIVKQLQDFKSQKRMDGTMFGMTIALDDTAMQDIAAHYASQTIKGSEADSALVARGQDIYRGGISADGIGACMGCHGPAGRGIASAKFPSLKGQHSAYLVAQMNKFKDGSRNNDDGQMMRGIVKKMSQTDIEAVASYISGM